MQSAATGSITRVGIVMTTASAGATTSRPSPMDTIAELLGSYFDRHSVIPVKDPWTRIMDGFLYDVHVSLWDGFVALKPHHYGLTNKEYEDEHINESLTWGKFALLDEELRSIFTTCATQARDLPKKFGWRVHWGIYVPLTAQREYEETWAKLESNWNDVLTKWEDNYSEYRERAIKRVRGLAANAYRVKCKLQPNAVLGADEYLAYENFAQEMIDQLMVMFPEPDELRTRYRLWFDVAFIPSPLLEAEQAKYAAEVAAQQERELERIRHEAEMERAGNELDYLRRLEEVKLAEEKVRLKRKLLDEHEAKTREGLKKRADRLYRDFQRKYAAELRNRLHESLILVTEGIKNGKLTPQASRSLRVVLDELKHIIQDGDVEMSQLRAKLDSMLGEPGSGGFTPAAVGQAIVDLTGLIQYEIYALGEVPRVPKRMQRDDYKWPVDVTKTLSNDSTVFVEQVRQMHERAGLESSLADVFAEGGFTLSQLEERRQRWDGME